MKFRVYRYNPDVDQQPYMQEFELEVQRGMMLRDALLEIKRQDESFAFRHSCGEGVCGSDGVNVNGRNYLACITPIKDLRAPIEVRPFPGRPVIRDLVVDMSQFYQQYQAVKPWLTRKDPVPEQEILQTPQERERLDGLWECILCGCCSTSCPSFWWNPDKFRGPQALLTAWRFLADSRDQAEDERLDELEGPYKLFRCHTIMNCVDACPKRLNPTRAIGQIKNLMLKKSVQPAGVVDRQDFPAMDRLRWQCRRGMLELDYLLGSFLERGYASLDAEARALFQDLLRESDQDLYHWLVGGTPPRRTAYAGLLNLIRCSGSFPPAD